MSKTLAQKMEYFYHLSNVYRNDYYGSTLNDLIPEDRNFYFTQAITKLEQYKKTYTVTAPNDKAEDMAILAMADALYFFANAQNGSGTVTSAAIGSVSVSYSGQNGVDLSPKAQERELLRCASQYLDIYRGVC